MRIDDAAWIVKTVPFPTLPDRPACEEPTLKFFEAKKEPIKKLSSSA